MFACLGLSGSQWLMLPNRTRMTWCGCHPPTRWSDGKLTAASRQPLGGPRSCSQAGGGHSVPSGLRTRPGASSGCLRGAVVNWGKLGADVWGHSCEWPYRHRRRRASPRGGRARCHHHRCRPAAVWARASTRRMRPALRLPVSATDVRSDQDLCRASEVHRCATRGMRPGHAAGACGVCVV